MRRPVRVCCAVAASVGRRRRLTELEKEIQHQVELRNGEHAGRMKAEKGSIAAQMQELNEHRCQHSESTRARKMRVLKDVRGWHVHEECAGQGRELMWRTWEPTTRS